MVPPQEPPARLPAQHEVRSYHPLVVVVAAALAGIVLDRYAGPGLGPWLGLAGLGLALWAPAWCFDRHGAATLMLLVAVAGVAGGWHHCCWRLFPDDELGRYAPLETQPVCLEVVPLGLAEALPTPEFDPLHPLPQQPRSRLKVSVAALRDGPFWRPASGRTTLLVFGPAEKAAKVVPGHPLRVFARFSRLHPPRNPGEFDFAAHARADRRLCRLRTNDWACVQPIGLDAPAGPDGGPWATRFWAVLMRIRGEGIALLREHLAQSQSQLAGAVLLGARHELEDARIEAFVQTGTVHLLAISGLHIGLVAGGLGAALRRLMVPRVATALMVAAAAVVYALLTEARPPALRATVLVVLGSLAYCMGRRPLSANLIAAAGLVVIAVNPGEVFRTGTQLSFLAVASLAYFRPWRWLSAGEENPLVAPPGKAAPWYLRMGRQFLVGAGSLFLVGMVIWLVALPLVASRFHLVAPVALPLNPLLWPFMSLAMVSGFGVLVTGWLWSVPAAACGQWCNGSLAVLETAVAVARDLPCGHFWVPGPAGWWLVGFYGGLAGMAVAPRLRPPPRWQAALLAGWIAVGFSVSTWRSPNDEFRCTFLSVGHGCAIVAQLPSGKTLLYDCGGLIGPDAVSQSVASALWDSGITHLDAVVLSHADVDHFNGLPKLLERFSVGVVYVSPVMFHGDSAAVSALERALGQRGVRLQPVFGGDRLVDPTCLLEILHPPRGGVIGEDNANSVVLRIETPHCRVLLPGDLESPGLNDVLAEEPQDCDVLLAPHHGSASGNPQELAAWCSPDIVVISGASYSNWDKAARAYRASGARVLHTGTEGAICVRPGVDGTIAEAKPPRLSW